MNFMCIIALIVTKEVTIKASQISDMVMATDMVDLQYDTGMMYLNTSFYRNTLLSNFLSQSYLNTCDGQTGISL